MRLPSIALLFFMLLMTFSMPVIASETGAFLYGKNCARCHGPGGEGVSAPALRKDGLLRTVGQDYFARSIKFGRPTLGCPSFEGRMSGADMDAVASYIKSWQKGATLEAPDNTVEPRETRRGEEIFMLCGGCHGTSGEGAMGPPLLDPGLLSSISDTELRRTTMWGRPGTPMKGYLKGMGGLATLTPEEIDQLISYIRFRQKQLKQ